jgi:hypothetical protein
MILLLKKKSYNHDYLTWDYSELPWWISNIYPMIVYIEERYIAFFESDKAIMDRIYKTIKDKLQSQWIDSKIVGEYPFQYCSVDEFSCMINILQHISIKDFFDDKLKDQKYRWY